MADVPASDLVFHHSHGQVSLAGCMMMCWFMKASKKQTKKLVFQIVCMSGSVEDEHHFLFDCQSQISVERVASRYQRPPSLQHHSSNFIGATFYIVKRLEHLVLSVHCFPSYCYRDVDKQVNGLVLFGTQPSSHVEVRIYTRAWLERYIHGRHPLL